MKPAPTQQQTTPSPRRVVIAGGGTGGHLFPGLAIAESLHRQDPPSEIRFFSVGNALEKRVLARAGFPLTVIAAAGLKGQNRLAQVRALGKLGTGVLKSLFWLLRVKPHCVVGMGGYASAPVVAGAWFLGIPVLLHEQNARPGITNQWLARLADRVCVSHEQAGQLLPVPPDKWRCTGNPVRRSLVSLRQDRRPVAPPDGVLRILVLGGSQGAHRINQAVAEALDELTNRSDLFFVHQTGAADADMVRRAYAQAGIAGTVQDFFDDMAVQYQRADFVIGRAGATTVAELTCLGKAALLVPFPYAADDHQTCNAQALVSAGAAELIAEKDLTGRYLAEKIDFYATHPEQLAEMARHSAALGHPAAAAQVVEECLALMAGPHKLRAVVNPCI